MSDLGKDQPPRTLSELQQKFREKLPAKISEIETLWSDVLTNQSSDFSSLHLKLHSLVGTSGTYSAIAISEQARKIEIIILSLSNTEIALSDDIRKKVNSYIQELKTMSEHWQPSELPYIPQSDSRYEKESENWNNHVYLVEDDNEIAQSLIDYLESNGYKVFYFRDITAFEEGYFKNEPASAIIMDMSFSEGYVAGADTIKRLSLEDKNFPPVLFISVHDDIKARLAAVQAGGKRYFTKPINQVDFLYSLNKLTQRIEPAKYRILLVDDDEESLNYYATIIRNSGFEVAGYNDAIEGYNAIDSFKPDLLLLDIYMPGCSGLDIAKVIRQNDMHAHLPIVFLSSEMDTGTQLAAIDLGGDDFLMKPVLPEHLVQAISSRVKRYRHIKNLHEELQDSLLESEFRLVTLEQHAIVCIADEDGFITYINKQYENISGYSPDELIGKNFTYAGSAKFQDITSKYMWDEISSGNIWKGQVCKHSKNGDEFWLELTVVPFINKDGKPYKYVSVGTNVTEIKNSEIKAHEDELLLIKAKEESEKANSLKTEFLANMSHELRTPLNAISGFAQIMLMDADEKLDSEQKENLQEIEKASSHLLLLISELLNLSQIEAGKFRIDCETTNFASTLIECVSLVNSLVERKGITIILENEGQTVDKDELAKSETNINVDPVRFKQVLINIINNALNYNRKNGTVTISTHIVDDSRLRVSVTDTGEGISKENLEQLFITHNRLGKENTDIEGTGLGLVIAKKLTNAMGGQIGVESELGKGTTFWLEFPLDKDELDLMRI